MSNSKEKPTVQQMRHLARFMVEHTDFALNRIKTGSSGIRMWEDLAAQLNARGPPQRTVDKWRKTWVDYKYIIRKRVRQEDNCILPVEPTRISGLQAQVATLLNKPSSSSNNNTEAPGEAAETVDDSYVFGPDESGDPLLEIMSPASVSPTAIEVVPCSSDEDEPQPEYAASATPPKRAKMEPINVRPESEQLPPAAISEVHKLLQQQVASTERYQQEMLRMMGEHSQHLAEISGSLKLLLKKK